MSQQGYNQYQYPNYPNVQQNNSLEVVSANSGT
jgi:hypothetical protein